MASVECTGCGRRLTERAAGISTCPMGDELIHSYFLCPGCQRWTVELYHDRFLGEDSLHVSGPLPLEAGQRDVDRIRSCPAPHDKWCACEVHRTWR